MVRKHDSDAFVVTPLSSPELDGHFGTPSAKKVNEDAAALLAQMTVEKTNKIKKQRDAETHLAKLDKRSLAKEVTVMPQIDEAGAVEITDFVSGMHEGFAKDLGNELESRPGVKLTKEALAAILGDAAWLERLLKGCKEYVVLEQEHGARVIAAVLDADESDEKLAA